MSRKRILSRIRVASAGPSQPKFIPSALTESLACGQDDAVATFRAKAEANGVTVVEIGGLTGLPAAILRTLGSAPHLRCNDAACLALPWRESGIAAEGGAAAPDDRIGLSRAIAAIAETGTLMLASGPGNPASLAFLPETHWIVIARSAIVPAFEDALATLRHGYGTDLPRAVNFISGASRTGDIGGRIVHGAHGPRRLVVFID